MCTLWVACLDRAEYFENGLAHPSFISGLNPFCFIFDRECHCPVIAWPFFQYWNRKLYSVHRLWAPFNESGTVDQILYHRNNLAIQIYTNFAQLMRDYFERDNFKSQKKGTTSSPPIHSCQIHLTACNRHFISKVRFHEIHFLERDVSCVINPLFSTGVCTIFHWIDRLGVYLFNVHCTFIRLPATISSRSLFCQQKPIGHLWITATNTTLFSFPKTRRPYRLSKAPFYHHHSDRSAPCPCIPHSTICFLIGTVQERHKLIFSAQLICLLD